MTNQPDRPPSNPRSTAAIRFSVLGPLSCRVNDERINLGGAKQQMVLALLLLEANSVVSVDRLLDWVWPDLDGAGSPSTLQVYVSNLRRLLADVTGTDAGALISTERPGYRINLRDEELDLLEFRRLTSAAANGADPTDSDLAGLERRAGLLRQALTLWQGECLAGLPVDAANSAIITGVEQARVGTRERLGEAGLDLGRHDEILSELQEWVAAYPHNERLRGQLMLALYRCGRQADALACYKHGRGLLLDELGIDPSRELRELEERILNQDPSLDLAGRRIDLFDDAGSTRLRESALRSTARVEIDGRSVELDSSVTTIGRMADRDIVVPDTGVSRRHCEIRRSGATYQLADTGSSNGTVVNGERVAEARLSDGDRIRVGDTVLVFRYEVD